MIFDDNAQLDWDLYGLGLPSARDQEETPVAAEAKKPQPRLVPVGQHHSPRPCYLCADTRSAADVYLSVGSGPALMPIHRHCAWSYLRIEQ